jgi:hypothetical protein
MVRYLVYKKVNMNIIFYSDYNYEYQAKALIESILLNISEKVQMVYYTIGFESSLEYENLIKVPYEKDLNKKSYEFYKPSIMLDAISKLGGDFLFLDTDILIGRRFEISKIINNLDIPLFPYGNWDYPFLFDGVDSNGNHVNFRNEEALMKYFGVNKRSMNYVYTCVCSFNEKCSNILKEWKSMCEYTFLLEEDTFKYYPFKDETPLNIILWKRGITNNLGRIYLNTVTAEPLIYIEENENIIGDAYNMGIFENPNMKCENSSDIILYHGIKDKNEINIVLNHMNNVKNISYI